MKLGKALATGVAEERPQLHEEQADLQVADIAGIAEPVEEAPAPEEAPVAR